jgi:predicted N-acetyltransferase YhbS
LTAEGAARQGEAVLIRRETPADTGAVRDVTATAFAPFAPEGGIPVEVGLGAADALDEPLVALLGSPDYYARFGFRLAEEYGITPPVPGWRPHFQVRALAAYEHESGAFAYPEPFDRV